MTDPRINALVVRLWSDDTDPAVRALRLALAPAELLFAIASGSWHRAHDRGVLRRVHAGIPTISIGNLTVGGAGKTPFTRYVVDQLLRRGRRPGILHGGYATDEPALLRGWFPALPVIALRDRVRGATQARAAGADALVLDDAFQHRGIARDLDVVLVSAEQWTRRPRLLPRGPWREPMRALARADLVVVTRKTATRERAAAVAAELVALGLARAVAVAAIHAARWQDGPPARCVAVAAIADPARFFEQATSAGADVVARLAFPDHHEYDTRDAAAIRAAAAGGAVATTEKDAVKLRPLLPDMRLSVLLQDVHIEAGEDALAGALDEVVG